MSRFLSFLALVSVLLHAGTAFSLESSVRPLNAAEAPAVSEVAVGMARRKAQAKILPVRVASPAAVQVMESPRRKVLEELGRSMRGLSEPGVSIR